MGFSAPKSGNYGKPVPQDQKTLARNATNPVPKKQKAKADKNKGVKIADVKGKGEDKGKGNTNNNNKNKTGKNGKTIQTNNFDDLNKKDPATTPVNASALTGNAYNPFKTPFATFRMSPYLLSGPRTAGRPSLVRSGG